MLTGQKTDREHVYSVHHIVFFFFRRRNMKIVDNTVWFSWWFIFLAFGSRFREHGEIFKISYISFLGMSKCCHLPSFDGKISNFYMYILEKF